MKKAFRASAGSLAAAVAVASGGDMQAAIASYMGAAGLAERASGKVINKMEGLPNFARTQIDMANGNNNMQKAAKVRKMMNDENNLKYIRDKMVKEEGVIPSSKKVRQRMEQYAPFFDKNLNIEEATNAMNAAKELGLDNNQAATMLAYMKDREITKAKLDKKDERQQAENNVRNELINRGRNSEDTENITNSLFNFAGKYYGSAKQK